MRLEGLRETKSWRRDVALAFTSNSKNMRGKAASRGIVHVRASTSEASDGVCMFSQYIMRCINCGLSPLTLDD